MPRAELGCDGRGFRDAVGVNWVSVGTLHYPKNWPQVFGVQVSAGHRRWMVGGAYGSRYRAITGRSAAMGIGGLGKVGDEGGGFYVGTGHMWESAESRFAVEVAGDG